MYLVDGQWADLKAIIDGHMGSLEQPNLIDTWTGGSVDLAVREYVNAMTKETPETRTEWSYTPPNYFEEQLILEREDYSIEISDGHITAKIATDILDSKPDLCDSLTQELNDYFLHEVE